MKNTFDADVAISEFDEFALKHPLNNLFQDSRWAEVKKESWSSLRTGLRVDGVLVGVSLILIRKLPLGLAMWYLPRGPLFDFDDPTTVKEYLNHLVAFAKKKRAIVIKIDPNLLLSSLSLGDARAMDPIRSHPVIDLMKECGFIHSGFPKTMSANAQPRYTACFYYDHADWQAKMSTKTQNIVRKAIAKGVEVEEIGVDRMHEFARIMTLTEKRKSVSLRNETYFKRLKEIYKDDCLVLLSRLDQKKQVEIETQRKIEFENQLCSGTLAHHKIDNTKQQLASVEKEIKRLNANIDSDGDIVNMSCALAIHAGDNVELLYAGLDERYKKYYAPYVANFTRIEWGHKLGALKCDLGGIEGTLDDGLTEYKGAFSPNIDEFIGEFDYPVRPVYYRLFTIGLPYVKKTLKKIASFRRPKEASGDTE